MFLKFLLTIGENTNKTPPHRPTTGVDHAGHYSFYTLHAPQCSLDLPAFVVITQDRAHNSKSRPYLNFIAICSIIISWKATRSSESMIHNRGTLSGHSCKTSPKHLSANDQRRSGSSHLWRPDRNIAHTQESHARYRPTLV